MKRSVHSDGCGAEMLDQREIAASDTASVSVDVSRSTVVSDDVSCTGSMQTSHSVPHIATSDADTEGPSPVAVTKSSSLTAVSNVRHTQSFVSVQRDIVCTNSETNHPSPVAVTKSLTVTAAVSYTHLTLPTILRV